MAEGQSPRKPLGNVRDGAPDEGGSIKIGSRASVGGALPTAVDDGDRVPILLDEFGRLLVVATGSSSAEVEGFTPHDDPDPGDENPVYVGGFSHNTPDGHAVSADGDRAGFVTDRQSRLRARLSGLSADAKAHLDVPLDDFGALMVGGARAHGATLEATNYPIKLGAVAEDEAPAAVVDGRMVRLFADLVGRLQINHPLGIAGENQVQDWLRTHEAAAAVEQGAWLRTNANAVASLVVKASAGRLRQIAGANTNTAARYLMAFNATATPANGTAPVWVAEAGPAAASGDIARTEFDGSGMYFDTGITLAWSSTALTLTLATASEHSIFARYF